MSTVTLTYQVRRDPRSLLGVTIAGLDITRFERVAPNVFRMVGHDPFTGDEVEIDRHVPETFVNEAVRDIRVLDGEHGQVTVHESVIV